LSSCELIDSATLEICLRATGLSRPLDSQHPFYMLLETSGSHEGHDSEKVQQFLEKMMESGVVQNGLMTSEPSKMQVRLEKCLFVYVLNFFHLLKIILKNLGLVSMLLLF